MEIQHTKIYKGIDLLDKILEFSKMTPDTKLWSINSLQDNQPRLIRLKQINSLLSAFFQVIDEKPETIHTILSGEFLEKQDVNNFTELIELMKATVNSNIKRDVYISDLIMVYQQLINFKKALLRVLTFNSSWIEASSMPLLFSIYLINTISNNLTDKYSELDRVIELFINPKKLSFKEDELIAIYGFPIEDLNEVDIENL